MMGRNKGSEEREEEGLCCRTGACSSGNSVLLRIVLSLSPYITSKSSAPSYTAPSHWKLPLREPVTAAMSHERVAFARRRGEVEQDFIAQYPGTLLPPPIHLSLRHWSIGQWCGMIEDSAYVGRPQR